MYMDCNEATKEELIEFIEDLKQKLANTTKELDDLRTSELAKQRQYEILKGKMEKLLSTELTMQALINAPKDFAILLDRDFTILAVNEPTARRMGGNPISLIGKNALNLIAKEIRETRRAKFLEVLDTGKPIYFIDDRNGTYVENSLYPVFNLDGEVNKIAIWGRDISDDIAKKELYKIVLETAIDGFVLMDAVGNILEVNKAFCKMLQYTSTELLKMSLADFEGVEKGRALKEHVQKIITQGSDRFKTKLICKDESLVDVEVSVRFLDIDGGRFTCFVREV